MIKLRLKYEGQLGIDIIKEHLFFIQLSVSRHKTEHFVTISLTDPYNALKRGLFDPSSCKQEFGFRSPRRRHYSFFYGRGWNQKIVSPIKDIINSRSTMTGLLLSVGENNGSISRGLEFCCGLSMPCLVFDEDYWSNILPSRQ